MPKKKGEIEVDAGIQSAGKLTVTDQQSRFQTEATDHSAGKEIVVKDLSISLGQREILKDAHLHLQPGRHYVLVGRNGIGKSTLLNAIATDQVPSIPRGIRILLLGQTQNNFQDDQNASSLVDQTVLGHVLRSDRVRETFLREAQDLSQALDDVNDPGAAVKAYRRVVHERLEREVADAKLTATKRSGARGKRAREVLILKESELQNSAARLEQQAIDDGEIGRETKNAAELLAEIQTSLDLIDAAAAESRARSILLGLGFTQGSIDGPIAQLSGGWKTRCQLACALYQPADILLLDEPTNFLDLPSIIWLEKYITEGLDPFTTVVVVTHDRAFADEVAEELVVLRDLQLHRHRGNLSNFELEKIKNVKWRSSMKDAQDKQKKHMEKTIENNVKAAKRTGDDKKLKAAASRKKKLDERMGMEVSAKGHRFRLNDQAGFFNSSRPDFDIPTFDAPVRLSFPIVPVDLRFPGALLSLEKVTFAYVVAKKRTTVLQDVGLTVHLGERVGICGLNGAGKSTLVGVAMGTLSPTAGTVTRHTRARFGVFSQLIVEELNDIIASQPRLTALAHLMDFAGSDLAEKDARALLGSLGLHGKTVSEVPLAMLSGGQKVRLGLAKLLWTPPHLLILDEVTTHLDSDTIDGLIRALRHYEGAILIITHDRFFMRCVVEGESPSKIARSHRLSDDNDDDDGLSDEDETEDDDESKPPGVIYRLAKGKLTKLEGGMEQYESIAAKALSKLGKA